eukprot:4108146-Pleurochrysis_carterae.AAC.1
MGFKDVWHSAASNDQVVYGWPCLLRVLPGLLLSDPLDRCLCIRFFAPLRALRQRFDFCRAPQVPMIMEKLAYERAQACKDALVARGVPSASMSVESEASTGEMKVDFIPYTDAVVQASATLPQLLVGEKFSLATVDSGEGSISGWEPAGCVRTGRCDFTVDPEGQDEVVLKLRPRDATVHVTP